MRSEKWRIKEEKRVAKLISDFNAEIEGIDLAKYFKAEEPKHTFSSKKEYSPKKTKK